MLSAGVEGIWLKAAGKTNHYFKPRGSVSATWMINRNNSLQLSYTLSNTAPSVSNLNPYNISADSLVVECGNPYLKPQTMNYIGLSYTYNCGNLYLTPGTYYKRITDMIEQYGFTDNGIYTNTYENMGHFRRHRPDSTSVTVCRGVVCMAEADGMPTILRDSRLVIWPTQVSDLICGLTKFRSMAI